MALPVRVAGAGFSFIRPFCGVMLGVAMNTLSAATGVLVVLVLMLSAAQAAPATAPVVLKYDRSLPPVRFGASEIRCELAAAGRDAVEADLSAAEAPRGGLCVMISAERAAGRRLAAQYGVKPPARDGEQCYALRRIDGAGGSTVLVLGADPVGAMYGALDVAEAVRLGTLAEMRDSDHAPHVVRRGIKFNIPLDLRTPSYSDNSDAAQQNIPEMWSMDFWREMLDEMARRRFNVLTLWNLHPFPSLVKVPEYPDVALNDVLRTKMRLDDSFSHTGSDMLRPEMLREAEVVRHMTIDEKIRFWRDVMQHARDRGIEVYLFTWNIFVFGTMGKYGITASQTNPVTIDYFRASVRQTVLTYPLLAGMGITAGEQMENRKDEFSKEKWLWKTYGEGIRDALKLQSGRQFRLIHRYHQTGQADILENFKDYPGPFEFSFKYAIAHMYASTSPPFIKPVLAAMPAGMRTWLTVRNDDIYSFRWGDPTFAREFIRNMPPAERLAGFYMGPDGYIWGREFIDTEPLSPRQLVMKKQWYSFMLWGRLAYEPDLPDEHFRRTLATRFSQVPADRLFDAWSAASRIFPQITRFFWGDIDLRWFPEACLSHRRHKGFYTVRHFIEGATMPASGIMNIRQYTQAMLTGRKPQGITPLQVAGALEADAAAALEGVAAMRPLAGENRELRLTLGDLAAMAHLGNYYAAKIRAATNLAMFDGSGRAEARDEAVRWLEKALKHWEQYAAAATAQYRPQLLNRVGYVDLNALTEKVRQDIEMARQWQPGTVKMDAGPSRDADRPFVR